MTVSGPSRARILLNLLYISVSLWYFHWRLGTFNHDALIFSWTLYVAELFGFGTMILHVFMTWRLTDRKPPPPAAGLSVDVFIPTINEPVDMVRRTVAAAQNMNYPHETWLLDDGNRPEMRELARELECRYLARTKNENAKAGNLNHALVRSRADLVVVFDSDDAPNKNFLVRTLGFFDDPQVALVQTPQDFYNLDSYQHRRSLGERVVWTEQSLFFRVIMRGKDYWDSAFFCGSCGVLRRSALEAIGGFATTLTEDMHTSIKLHKKGYRSVYYAEPLAFGLAPPSVVPFLRQRVRWGQGAMQILRKEGLLLGRGLSLPQRLCYLASLWGHFDGWQKVVFYLTPVIALTAGVLPINALGLDFLLHGVPYLLLTFLVFEREIAPGFRGTLWRAQYNMARFFASAWSTLALFRHKLRFRVTQKNLSRVRNNRLYLVPQYFVLFLSAAAIPLGIILHGLDGELTTSALILTSVWAALNCALAFAVLRFSVRQASSRRTEYRFPVPLPVRIKTSRLQSVYGTVDDISPSGVRLHGRFAGEIEPGTPLDGEIYLPDLVVPFSATVRTLVEAQNGDGRYVKALGCRFDAQDRRDALERFLFGSDLQWRIHRLREQLDSLVEEFAVATRFGPKDGSIGFWAPIVFDLAQTRSSSQVGLVAASESRDGTRDLVTYRPLPVNSHLVALVFNRSGQSLLQGEVISAERLDTQLAPIYISQMTATTREQEWLKNNLPKLVPIAEQRAA